jgi:hypothetical protein
MIQQIEDQLALEIGVAVDRFDPSALLGGIEVAISQQARPAQDGIQRIAQLVRQRGQELVLELIGLLGLATGDLLPEEDGPLLLHPEPLGHVLPGPQHPDRRAGRVAHDAPAREGVNDAAVGTNNAVLEGECLAISQGALDGGVDRFPILRMDPFEEGLVAGAE